MEVDDAFYFVIDEKPKRTRTGLKRLRNIAANPQVALVIDDYDDDWRRLAYLLLQGQAAVVAAQSEYDTALTALRQRYPQYRVMPLAFGTHPMVRIVPQRRHLWRASPPVARRSGKHAQRTLGSARQRRVGAPTRRR